ncbi:MAG: zinc-ribbon domain-containing protein, partial [Myxococcaceae bacterium]|nr:zinc-ribbon domain-containing protein [Myxococcaceae bacterium]
MIVTCEQCKTRFKIPDDKVSERGVKVRCMKCGHTFRAMKDGSSTLSLSGVMPAPSAAVGVPLDSADPFSRFGMPEAPQGPAPFDPPRVPEGGRAMARAGGSPPRPDPAPPVTSPLPKVAAGPPGVGALGATDAGMKAAVRQSPPEVPVSGSSGVMALVGMGSTSPGTKAAVQSPFSLPSSGPSGGAGVTSLGATSPGAKAAAQSPFGAPLPQA